MIDAGKQNGYQIEILVRKDTAKSNRQTIREQLSSFGLKESVLKDLTSRIEKGKINSNHISDIRKTNLLEDISSLNEESQQKAVEEIINIRNERDLLNSENISLLVLNSGKVSKFLVENWYRGIIRTIERLILQAEVSQDIIDELLIEQKMHLSDRINFLIKKLERLLILLDHQKTQKNITDRGTVI